jgi:DNA topoisomerase-1
VRLIVTEKSTTARRIAQILSRGKAKALGKSGNAFAFRRDGEEYRCLGLKGHILRVDFPPQYQQWQSIDPRELVSVDIVKIPNNKVLLKTVQSFARDADELIIATDYDREGELIGADVVSKVQETNPGIRVWRARFSALTPQEIEHAFSHLEKLDDSLAQAGEARQDIDLVWGASLTRFISLASTRLGKQFLSVGRVQSPTLALIVDREKERKEFVPTTFWTVKILCEKEGERFIANHRKERFDQKGEAELVFSRITDRAEIVDVVSSERTVDPPVPFNTTGFLSAAASLGLPAAKAMSIAENLYMNGLISYPRVDNTVYPPSLNLKELLKELSSCEELGHFCREILALPRIKPTRGKKETTDHPPIHPTGVASSKGLSAQEWKVYELIFRRFLANLASQAIISSVRADLVSGGEPFVARGSRVAEEGWLRYYPYQRKKDILLPTLAKREEVSIVESTLEEGQTQPPPRYTQGRLIEKMEELGLGTKSTRHSIIESLYERGYIHGDPIIPTETGMAVTEALRKYARVISTPEMTARLEEDMDAIAVGEIGRKEVVDKSRTMLAQVIDLLEASKRDLVEEIRNGIREDKILGECPRCGGNLRVLKAKKSRKRFVGCSKYPDCTTTYPLPQQGSIVGTGEVCPECGSPRVKVIVARKKPWVLCLDPECATKKKAES